MVAYGDGRRNIGLASALTVTDTSNQQLPYPGEKARGADIVVRRPWEPLRIEFSQVALDLFRRWKIRVG
jgi:hypothetical protein